MNKMQNTLRAFAFVMVAATGTIMITDAYQVCIAEWTPVPLRKNWYAATNETRIYSAIDKVTECESTYSTKWGCLTCPGCPMAWGNKFTTTTTQGASCISGSDCC